MIDPEGDYETTEKAVSIGTAKEAPAAATILDLLRKTDTSVAVNLVGVGLNDRPGFFAALLPGLLALRGRTGRPHFVVVDEAHHVLPASQPGLSDTLPAALEGIMFITVKPEAMPLSILERARRVIAVGAEADTVIEYYCRAHGLALPPAAAELDQGELLTMVADETRPRQMLVIPGRGTQLRHPRKYAEGDLGDDKRFFFRGADDKLNLQARNLLVFMDLSDGVDNETWEFHRRWGDYSRWIALAIKDVELSHEVAEIEQAASPTSDAKAAIRATIERRYTLPAEGRG